MVMWMLNSKLLKETPLKKHQGFYQNGIKTVQMQFFKVNLWPGLLKSKFEHCKNMAAGAAFLTKSAPS